MEEQNDGKSSIIPEGCAALVIIQRCIIFSTFFIKILAIMP
jgi:hypothetical protein